MSTQQATESADTEIEQNNDTETENLRELLEASFDAAEATADTKIEATDGEPGDDEVITGDDLTTGDEAAAAEQEAAETGDTETQDLEASDDTTAGADDKIEYPEHWDKATKDSFDELPKAQQEFVVSRIKSMEADYTKKRQADSDIIKAYEPVAQIMAPFKQDLQQAGISEGELIRRWAVAENHLNTNPHAAIKQIANHYNVDLTTLAYGGEHYSEAPAVDPVVQNLTSQVAGLQQTISTQQAEQQLASINAFADAADDQGNKAHPYFDEVLQDVMLEVQIDRQQGKQPDLSAAYERACYRNTSVREKMLAAQRDAATDETKAAANAAAAKKTQEARLKAEQAKKAGKSVVGDPGGQVEAKVKHGNVRSALDDAWNANS